jgi:hypothetical protein
MEIDYWNACCGQTVQERRRDDQHKARTDDDIGLVLQHHGGEILEEGLSGILATVGGCRMLFLVFEQAAKINMRIDGNGDDKTNLIYPIGIPAYLALSRPYAFSRLETENNHLFSALERRGI